MFRMILRLDNCTGGGVVHSVNIVPPATPEDLQEKASWKIEQRNMFDCARSPRFCWTFGGRIL